MKDKQAETNIDVAQSALMAIAEGKLDEAMAQFEPEAKWSVAKALPEAGVHEGADAIRKMLAAQRERFPGGYQLVNLSVHGAHDHAFAEFTRAKGGDAYADGSEHVLTVFSVVMGKIREVRDFVHRS